MSNVMFFGERRSRKLAPLIAGANSDISALSNPLQPSLEDTSSLLITQTWHLNSSSAASAGAFLYISMFPPNKSHLSILRPSPTTVSFTVSTRSSYHSLPSQALYHFLLILRFLILAATIVILASKLVHPTPPFLETLSVRVTLIPWSYLAPAIFIILFVVFRRFYTGNIPPLHLLVFLMLYFPHNRSTRTILNPARQKNPSSPSLPSASRRPVSPHLTFSQQQLDSSQLHPFETFSFMKPLGVLR